MRGFEPASQLLRDRIRVAGESRGFAVAKVLTHWAEIAGPDLAGRARPVKVSYPRHGLGATLTLVATGAEAPFVEMQKEVLRERVNACYGYNAVARIRVTQSAPEGLAESPARYTPAPPAPVPRPEALAVARQTAEGVRDETLRAALEDMGRTILSGSKPKDS